MRISELIEILEEAESVYGDIEVYVDQDYGQRPVEKDEDPLCLVPQYEEETENMPERIVI